MSATSDDHREPVGAPDDGSGDPHLTDEAVLEKRDKAQPGLLGDRANLRADEPDDTEAAVAEAKEERRALVDEVEEEREAD